MTHTFPNTMRITAVMVLFFSLCTPIWASLATFESGNTAYADGRYRDAVALYQTIIAEQPNAKASEMARVYYNLGNAQFKQGELAQAILAYERALRLDPRNEDIKHNLRFAQSRITDDIKDNDFFLSSWVKAVRNSASEEVWRWVSVGLFILGLVGILLFLLSPILWLRKSAFYIALLALFISLCAGLNARSLHQRDTLRNEAIITQGIVNAKSSPDRSGTDLFTIHEGTKVTIGETIGEWVNIRVAQYEGWIPMRTLERI